MEVQKALTSFINTEASDKTKPGSKTSEYKYVPGWQITQEVRKQMDNHGLMMPVSIISENHQMVEYPVYKMIDGKVVSFVKKENLSVITMQYTWVDTETGETTEPYVMVASGANGIDKSTASALSAAERYIFLKFFHIPTKDADELDAHDSANIPGMNNLHVNATDSQIARYKDETRPTTLYPQPLASQPTPACTYGQEYEAAVNAIAMFAKGTQSHTDCVNRTIVSLSRAGYPTNDKAFIDTLVETANDRRNGTKKY